jgi:hypothetical protein
VDNGVLEDSRAHGDLEGALEEMRKLKNERRFENRSMVRQDDREMSMKIEDILEEGKDPVSLGFL